MICYGDAVKIASTHHEFIKHSLDIAWNLLEAMGGTTGVEEMVPASEGFLCSFFSPMLSRSWLSGVLETLKAPKIIVSFINSSRSTQTN